MMPSQNNRGAIGPFDALWDVRREMDRIFNGLTSDTVPWHLPAEVLETDNDLLFQIDVPGLCAEDVHLTVENNVLTVSGERRLEREDKNGEYHVFERRYGRFERSFVVPQRVDAGRIEASVENGVLSVTLPKAEEAKPRRIEIKSGIGKRIGAQI